MKNINLITKPYLSVIVPAYNEARRIPETLSSIGAYLSRVPFSYEVLVIDDGSRDGTAEIAKAFVERMENARVIVNKKNKGKGAAVRQGMLLASGAVRLFMDADNATTIDQFEKLLPYVYSGYDVVIGSRTVRGAELDPPESLPRRLAGRGLNLIIQAILLRGISDTQCGFKLFTARAAEAIFPRVRIAGWGFDVETLTLARRRNYGIKEIPVHWENRDGSHVVPSSGIQFLRDIIAIRWRLFTDAYPA